MSTGEVTEAIDRLAAALREAGFPPFQLSHYESGYIRLETPESSIYIESDGDNWKPKYRDDPSFSVYFERSYRPCRGGSIREVVEMLRPLFMPHRDH
jgi:hypothetical protein